MASGIMFQAIYGTNVKKYRGKKSMLSGTLIIVQTNIGIGQKFQIVETSGISLERFTISIFNIIVL